MVARIFNPEKSSIRAQQTGKDTMASSSTTQAILDDLYMVDGKAELINGRIVHFIPGGHLPTEAAQEIFVSLRQFAKSSGKGVAKAEGIGYAVPKMPSGQESFSPDASYFDGHLPADRMRFLSGPPLLQQKFAVKMIMVMPPRKNWPTNEPIISLQEPRSFGMSIPWQKR